MPTLKEIKEQISSVETIRNIANTYHEIANLKMRQIRESVIKNRDFFNTLLGVYQRVRSAALLNKKNVRENNPVGPKEKERVLVFLSANHPFYGELIIEIWKSAYSYFKENKTDLVVIGRIGKKLVEASGLGYKMFYFELDDEHPQEKNIASIVDFIKAYQKIVIFYGKYKSVLLQKPVMSEISELPLKETKNVEKYLFEPSEKEVLNFFEKEIVAVLFSQCLLEHQLSRYASRMIAMYKAKDNANKLKDKLEKIKRKIKWQLENKQLIELFSKIKTYE